VTTRKMDAQIRQAGSSQEAQCDFPKRPRIHCCGVSPELRDVSGSWSMTAREWAGPLERLGVGMTESGKERDQEPRRLLVRCV
jgi:hypothetical protein